MFTVKFVIQVKTNMEAVFQGALSSNQILILISLKA